MLLPDEAAAECDAEELGSVGAIKVFLCKVTILV